MRAGLTRAWEEAEVSRAEMGSGRNGGCGPFDILVWFFIFLRIGLNPNFKWISNLN